MNRAQELDMVRTVRALLYGAPDVYEEARLRSLAWSSFGWHLALEVYRKAMEEDALMEKLNEDHV